MTKNLAEVDCTIEEDKNRNIEERVLDSLRLLGTFENDDEDILDYYVIFLVLEKNNVENIQELLNIYINKYIESGEEAYNLFSLFLLLQLENKYNINNVNFKNGNQCSRLGHTVYLYDKEIDFCECLDWFQSIYEIKQDQNYRE